MVSDHWPKAPSFQLVALPTLPEGVHIRHDPVMLPTDRHDVQISIAVEIAELFDQSVSAKEGPRRLSKSTCLAEFPTH